MHFLKCSNCGHMNEVKTEYMTFCTKCNSRLENSYSNWSTSNPDKTFNNYKELICTTDLNEITKDKIKSNKPKGIKYWIGFAIAFAIFYAIGQLGGEKIAGIFREPAFDKVMMDVASEINKSCPIMIDNATRLDNAIALPDNVFQYNYTLVNMTKDSTNTEELKNYLEPTITNFVKTNPDMKSMRENKTTVNYYYKDLTGMYLFTISVKPEQYE